MNYAEANCKSWGAFRREACPLCDGTEFRAEAATGLLRCDLCGLIFDRGVWAEGADLLREAEWFEGGTSFHASGWTKLFEELNNRRTFDRIAKRVRAGSSLLEIGVGSGSFLAFARRRGLEAEGCDLSKGVCDAVTERTGVQVFHGPVSALPVGKVFDRIVMNHVLEHVCSPLQFLRDVRIRLKSDGILHIAVPNVDCWEAAFPAWAGYEPYHFTYFSRNTLERAVRQAGYSVVRSATHESFSAWTITALRSLFKQRVHNEQFMTELRRKRRDSWMELCYGATLALAGAVTTPTRYLQAWFGRGDELIMLCQPAEASENATG